MSSNAPLRGHLWVSGATRADRAAALDAIPLPPRLATIDAHRRLGGPYTAGGALVRRLAPDLGGEGRLLAERHRTEILAVAPELGALMPPARAASVPAPADGQGARFHPADRTLRLAQGLSELVAGHAARAATGPWSLVMENAHRADDTDLELIGVLLRRLDPALVTVVVCTGTDVPAPLAEALLRFALRLDATAFGVPAPTAAGPAADSARPYVWSDGTSDHLDVLAAYRAAPQDVRAALHDRRADELEATDDPSWRLGAIPYHREHGSDPHGLGADTLASAAAHCTRMGWYHAARELGYRAAGLMDWSSRPDASWTVTSLLAVACIRLGLVDEAGGLYDHACTSSTSPLVHAGAAYGRAMLYARHHGPERRDLERARMWVNTAIAVSSQGRPGERPAPEPAIGEEQLALLAQLLSDPEDALRVVDDAIGLVEAAPPADRRSVRPSVLHHNRADFMVGLGRLDEAVESYSRAIDLDPDVPEYRLERAAALQSLGDYRRAYADYSEAIRLDLPAPEAHRRRAELAVELGDLQGALRDYGRALELCPELAGPIAEREGLVAGWRSGRADGDAEDGAALDAKSSYRRCLAGFVATAEGRLDDAVSDFVAAIDADPGLAAAWKGHARAQLAQGSFEAAVHSFDTAVDLDDEPLIRAERDLALREGRAARAGALAGPGA